MVLSNDRPAYRILTPFPQGFFGPDDNLYREGECIYYDGEPNEEMEPLNEPARHRMIAFLEKLDKFAEESAAKMGRKFAGRPRDIDGALAVARYDEEYKLRVRGVVKDNTDIERVDERPIPEVGNQVPKRRGRPPYKNITVG